MNRAATPPLLAAPRAACHSARSRPRSTLGPVAPDHSFPETGLPSGLFLLQGGCRALTVDGRVVRLAPSRNPTVLRNESSLFNSVNSQVLFLDWDGHLQSVSAGKAVDCVGKDPSPRAQLTIRFLPLSDDPHSHLRVRLT